VNNMQSVSLQTMKNNYFSIPALLSLSLLALTACDGQSDKADKKSPAKEVVAIHAAKQALFTQIQALGTTTSSESVTITSPVSGIIKSIKFSDGQRVKQGQILAVLDQDETKAQLQSAKVQKQEHERELKRLETLLSRKAATSRDVDARKTMLALSQSSIKEIEARLDELTIRAPFAGVLGMRELSPGALLQPSQTITTLDAIDTLNLDFTMPSLQLSHIEVGTALQARSDALDGRVFKGHITAINTRIDPITRAVLVRAALDNNDGKLQPGLLMRVNIVANPRQALVVPEESITQKQEQHFLTLINPEGKVEIRPVTIGQRHDGGVEIIAGLSENEQVIVRGMGFVKPGQAVVATSPASSSMQPKSAK